MTRSGTVGKLWLLLALSGCTAGTTSHVKTQDNAAFERLLGIGKQTHYADSRASTTCRSCDRGKGDLPAVVHEEKASDADEIIEVRFAPSGQGLTRSDLEEAKEKILAEVAAVIKIHADEMRAATPLLSDVVDRKVLVMRFDRILSGRPVVDGRLQIVFTSTDGVTYSIREVLNRTYSSLSPVGPPPPATSFSDIAHVFGQRSVVFIASRGILFPTIENSIPRELSYATEITVQDSISKENLRVIVNDTTGEMLEAGSDRFQASLQLLAEVYPREQSDATRKVLPLPFVKATISAPDVAGSADGDTLVADANGTLSLSAAVSSATVQLDTDIATVYHPKSGRWRKVSVEAKVDPATSTLTIGDSGSGPEALAPFSAFVAINRIRNLVVGHIDPTSVPYLESAPSVFVNNTGFKCNAYYSRGDNSLNFARTSGNCNNTANLADTVQHEWGHGYVWGAYSGERSAAFNEGAADVMAMLVSGSNRISPGFVSDSNSDGAIRDLKNKLRYPGDVVDRESHYAGQVLAGSLYDLRGMLIEQYGEDQGAFITEKIFLNAVRGAPSMTDFYRYALTVDDDDNDPSNKTPNYCAILTAFARHGLAKEDPSYCPAAQANAPGPSPTATEDASLFLLVKASQGNRIELAASGGQDTQKLGLCVGEKNACIGNDAQVRFWFDLHPSSGAKKKFVSAEAVEITTAEESVVLLVRDSGGRTVKYRALKLKRQ